jgi:glutamate formiminotransferase / 5-formyltetrahydrofolate cyclo-ligase
VLLAVPNVSEGRDIDRVARISAAFATGAALLDTHSDPVHNRTVLTLSGSEGSLAGALTKGARACVEEIDMERHEGAHPRIGALDVCPVVWLTEDDRDRARAEALEAARRIGSEARLPVFLYGELATQESHRERAFFRAGGLVDLRRRLEAGELHPDYGRPQLHPSAGATLITARAPLAAFNVELDGASIEDAREIAARLREAGGGPAGVRAIGIDLGKGRAQISTNVHDPLSVPLAEVVARVRSLAAARGARVAGAEVVGLIAEAAVDGWPNEIPLAFDPATQTIERRVRA